MRARRPSSSDQAQPAFDIGPSLVRAFMMNERVNQILIGLLPARIWREFPPGSKRRNVATSFAHIHNVRCMRLKMSALASRAPGRLDRSTLTPDQAKRALAESAEAMAALIRASLATGGLVKNARLDVAAMVCAAISHEAHHRGQICHWARELGAPLSPEQQLELWDWPRLWRSVDAG